MSRTNTASETSSVSGQTAISSFPRQGQELAYRGYAVEDLAREASFEETTYLLLYGSLPTTGLLKDYQRRLGHMRALPEALRRGLELVPAATPGLDVIRSAVSILGALEPEGGAVPQQVADRLLTAIPGMAIYWHAYHTRGERIEPRTDNASAAAHVLQLVHGKAPAELERRALETTLILLAEEDRDPATLACRVAASAGADFFGAITAGVCALAGSAHGSAIASAIATVEEFEGPADGEQAILAAAAHGERVPGFDHPGRDAPDPRCEILKPWAKRLGEEADGKDHLLPIAERIEAAMTREHGCHPSVAFYASLVLDFLGIPRPLALPMLAFARNAGWAAHVLEQRGEESVIVPDFTYGGPPRAAYSPLAERG